MANMFASTNFNGDISKWVVSKVVDMDGSADDDPCAVPVGADDEDWRAVPSGDEEEEEIAVPVQVAGPWLRA